MAETPSSAETQRVLQFASFEIARRISGNYRTGFSNRDEKRTVCRGEGQEETKGEATVHGDETRECKVCGPRAVACSLVSTRGGCSAVSAVVPWLHRGRTAAGIIGWVAAVRRRMAADAGMSDNESRL